MVKNSFVMYTDYAEQIELLTLEQRGVLLTAVMHYATGNTLPDMDSATQIAFSFIRAQIDRDNKKYQEKIEKRKEAGKQGGRPKANDSSENQMKAKKANGFSEKQNNPDNVNVDDNENDNVNEKEKEDANASSKKKTPNNDVRFDAFWAAYPRKKHKATARKAWDKLRPSNDLLTTMLKAIEAQKKSRDWLKDKGEYIPYPATWLNAAGWEDEVEVETNGRIDGSEGFIAPDTSDW